MLELFADWSRTVSDEVTPVIPARLADPVGAAPGQFVVDQLLEVFAALRGGAQAETTDAVQRLTGPPQSFATWAATYADGFRRADSAALAG